MSIQKNPTPKQPTSSYGEDTIESAREKAKSLGQIVVFPQPNELFIDIDSEAAMRRFARGILRLPGTSYQVRPSPSGRAGRYHVVVTMPRAVSAIERIALQAALGSDRTREILSWLRLERGVDPPTIFFEHASTS